MKTITQKELVKSFRDIKEGKHTDIRFCFLLGAGASVSSGIPTGQELAKEWYENLQKELDPKRLEEWKKGIKFDPKDIGAFYPKIYEKSYERMPALGYAALKRLMDNKEPSLGYVVFSQILAHSSHNIVLTTNFDYLIEDALRAYTSKKPLSVGHELLAEYALEQNDRPTIIKVHRDVLLEPLNTSEETQTLKEEWQKALMPILKKCHMVVIGYGGNDGSLMDYLKTIKPPHRKSIYWCHREDSTISDKIKTTLHPSDFLVSIKGFDEFMYALHVALGYTIFDGIDKPDTHPFVENTKQKVRNLASQFSRLVDATTINPTLSPADTEGFLPDAWQYIFKIRYEKDIETQEKMYEKGLGKYDKNADFLAQYALFLDHTRKDYAQAGEYYTKALELEPNNADFNANYAHHIILATQDFERAEPYIDKAFAKVNTENKTLLAKLWFYKYAHYRQWYAQAEQELSALIDQRAKSIGWNLEPHIEIAKQHQHPNISQLQEFAYYITSNRIRL